MSLTVTLNLPPELETKLREGGANLENEVKEAFALELFRRGTISHYQLSQLLGLDRFETGAFLKRHKVIEGSLTMEDLDADSEALDRVLGKES